MEMTQTFAAYIPVVPSVPEASAARPTTISNTYPTVIIVLAIGLLGLILSSRR